MKATLAFPIAIATLLGISGCSSQSMPHDGADYFGKQPLRLAPNEQGNGGISKVERRRQRMLEYQRKHPNARQMN